MTEQCIFSCFVDPETVDNVVDCLLCQPFVGGFSVHGIEGYSKEHANYTVSEQVAGHRSVCRIDIRLQHKDLDSLTAALAALSLQHRIRYWVTPVIDSGIIQSAAVAWSPPLLISKLKLVLRKLRQLIVKTITCGEL